MKLALNLSIASIAILSSAAFADSYSTGFEDFTTGPMSTSALGPTQGGWSGGEVGGFVNNDTGDEAIINSPAGGIHSGAQSWQYLRGYNSPGSGTPYTPNLTSVVSNSGGTMTSSLWFKAAAPNDGSLLAIETGNPTGDDRAEIIGYIDNDNAGGLVVRSFTNGALFTGVPIASGLDASAWHQFSFTMTRTGGENVVSVSIDGASPVTFNGSLDGYRDSLLSPYSDSSRLKLRTRHADGDLTKNGFYIDDLSYSIAVPEPTTLAAIAGASVLGLRRRRV